MQEDNKNKKELKFRKLNADEIDVRVSQCSEKGVSLLLYKDARVDMRILDETVGALNWQKEYKRDNQNCVVSVWDETKQAWISKEDTGTESNTEKEKGLASDSFKRACFNWGIGRELYSAPRIWVGADKANIKANGKDARGNTKFACYDKFSVREIEYNDKGEISYLRIGNMTKEKGAYLYGKKADK